METIDFLVGPIYVIIIIFIAALMRGRYEKGTLEHKYFMPAVSFKLIGALAFTLIHQYYYRGGDTFAYYAGAKTIWEVIKLNPETGMKMFLATPGVKDPETFWYTMTIYYFGSVQTYTVVKITALIGLICFNSYLAISFLFSFISFTGVWALYRTFSQVYPELKKELAIAILFIPSVLFWGSGILKDTITLGCLGWLTYAFYSFFVRNKNMFISALLMLICSYLIFQIKAYILFTLAPGLIFWIIAIYRSKIRSTFFKFLITPFIVGLSVGMNYFVIEELAKEEQKFSFEKFVQTASSFQTWHGYLGEKGGYGGGSAYSLGEYETSPLGILKVAPKAINIALFRPYLWEVKNIVMIFSAIESLVILIFTIATLWKVGVFNILKILYDNPEVFFSVIFSLVFAFAVGFSSYNFGALVRYKIPCIPFYVAALFIIRYIHQQSLKSKTILATS